MLPALTKGIHPHLPTRRVACARTGPPGRSADLARRVELLHTSRWVAGVNGADCDTCTDRAWITLWREEAGPSAHGPECCAVAGCHKPAVRATHVWLHGGDDGTCACFCKDYCYVIPVCRDHSARRFNLPTSSISPSASGDAHVHGCGFRTKTGTRALRIRPHECYKDLHAPAARPRWLAHPTASATHPALAP